MKQQGMIGPDGARAVQDMIADSAEKKDTGIIATAIGMGTLLVAASGVFGQLQDAMNTIWEVKPKKGRGRDRAHDGAFNSSAGRPVFPFKLFVWGRKYPAGSRKPQNSHK